MYVTAHRVQRADGTEGINTFLHIHGPILWPAQPWHMPEQQPGKIIAQEIMVPPGGNRVRAYLDVLAPDGTHPALLEQTMYRCWMQLVSMELVDASGDPADPLLPLLGNPILFEQNGVTLRFGVEDGWLTSRALHFSELQKFVAKIIDSKL